MPHVTTFKFKAISGERQAVIDSFRRWQQERMPKVNGFIRSVLASSLDDADEFMVTVLFDCTESYNANSSDAEQGAWFQELRSHLVADPEWFNGNVELLTTV